MWKPDESLDDYIVPPVPEVTLEPPRPVLLRRTGEVEILEPLTPQRARAKPTRKAQRAFRLRVPYQPLWFRRFLAVGSGALVFIAFVLVSAILVALSDSANAPEVARNVISDEKAMTLEEPAEFDVSAAPPVAPVTAGVDVVRSSVRRRPARRSVRLAVKKPRPQLRPLP